METSENNGTRKRRMSMEDPLLVEIKQEEVEFEEYQSNYQDSSYIQNPFENPLIYGLAESFSSEEQTVNNQTIKSEQAPQEANHDARKPRKKIVPLRSGCLKPLDADNKISRVCHQANLPAQGEQSRISKKLTIRDYIALERENKKLKEMILDFTRDAEKIQDKLYSWTKTFKAISALIPKPLLKPPPAPEQLSTPKAYQGPTTRRRRLSRLPTAPKNSNSPGSSNDRPQTDVACIKRTTKVVNIPEFPITNVRELIDLEKKMRDTSYFSNVFDIIYVSYKKSTVEKSVPTLLNQIVFSELFKYFVWKDLPEGKRRLRMVDFPKFISLFLSLSVKLFGQNKDPKSLEMIVKQVLHSHITNANRRSLPVAPPKVQQIDLPPPPQTSLVVLNYDLNRTPEPSPFQVKHYGTPKLLNFEPPSEIRPNFSEVQHRSMSEDDMETNFTPETQLQTAEEDDEIEDVTPAPESIDIADDSD